MKAASRPSKGNTMKGNRRTTAAGIAAILTAAAGILNGWPDAVDWTAAISAIIAGIGLIMARDAGKDA
jgi:hypothetical protein